MWAQACDAIATSCDMGRKIATRSPSPTPSRTSASASRVTSRRARRRSAPPLPVFAQRDRGPRHPAGAPPSGARSSRRCSASRRRTTSPTRPRERSTTCFHGSENSRPMSSIAAGQNHFRVFLRAPDELPVVVEAVTLHQPDDVRPARGRPRWASRSLGPSTWKSGSQRSQLGRYQFALAEELHRRR